ncbi:hypothetical protein L3X38_036310 [Prunus dulcis]|uniref:Uncharacterized protein n=1 Tax=Prunus dulcis TaxID=3755 RepID=A0AAD4V2B2_PRUDU|nr:hypothetical protein L3X38_036310 [Prunus dulcis]
MDSMHALVEFSLTSRAERQARIGRVFTHLSCRKAGTHGSSFHSPLVPNGRHTWVEFSLTSRAELQARIGRVFTHLSCRTAGTHGSSFHSPLMSNGKHALIKFSLTSRAERQAHNDRVLPRLRPTSALGQHDYHCHTTKDTRTRVRIPELRDTSKPPTKKFLLDQKLEGLLFVPYLTLLTLVLTRGKSTRVQVIQITSQ